MRPGPAASDAHDGERADDTAPPGPTDIEKPGAALVAALGILARGSNRDGIDSAHPHGEAPPGPVAATMRRLAGELHDGPVQELLVAGYDLVELVETSELDPRARELVERVASRIDDAYALLRSVLTEMSRDDPQEEAEDDSDGVPLVEALRAYATGPRAPAPTRFVVIGSGPDPVGLARTVAFRTVREGLANVRKHAVASRAQVTFGRGPRWCKIDVDDDGLGDEHDLRRSVNSGRDEGYGLRSLASDAARAGGRLWISTAPALGGIRLSVSLPAGGR